MLLCALPCPTRPARTRLARLTSSVANLMESGGGSGTSLPALTLRHPPPLHALLHPPFPSPFAFAQIVLIRLTCQSYMLEHLSESE